MSQRYFDLSDDVYVQGRWHLDNPREPDGREVANPWIFNKGRAIPDPGRLIVRLDHPGKPLDFTMAGLSIPLVHPRVASVFTELAPDDVQTFPVDVEGQPEPFFILVATKLIRCIDDAACKEVLYWTPEDGRPEKTGQYRDIHGLRIDSSKVGGAKVFRTWGWSIVLVIREEIKDALEHIGATGAWFEEVA